MQKFHRFTHRVYNNQPHLSQITAKIIKIGENYIELDKTIAYAEGGGQEPDFGVLLDLHNSLEINFNKVKKIYTNNITLENFPEIEANGVIWHYIDEKDLGKLKLLQENQEIIIKIDIPRRAKLSISHSASHILYMAVLNHRKEAIDNIFGCHIKPEGARFDFYTDKFTENDVKNIESYCNQIIKQKLPIYSKTHEKNDDAKYWICDNIIIHCGGTHIENTDILTKMQIKRKGLGAGKERLSCSFEYDLQTQINKYSIELNTIEM